jgi:putative nucleotidyltransferase with HDIG domain
MKRGGRKAKKNNLVVVGETPANLVRLEPPKAHSPYPEILLESLRAVIAGLEEKDSYTHGHSIRVAEYSVMIAEEIGLSEAQVHEVEVSALFHDIGKIGIPDHILMKPARLTPAEFEIMKSHPVRSAQIMEKISALKNLIPGIRHHHERYDGLGYPDGLREEEIPLYARIILVADTYDAMTSTRPYRLALNKEIAFHELKNCSGTQFDPTLVDAFLRAMRKKDSGAGASFKNRITKKIA